MPKRLEHLLIMAAAGLGRKTCVISIADNFAVTYAALLDDAKRYADWLESLLGLGSARILLQAKNNYAFICAMFGAFLAGKTVIPASLELDETDISFIATDSRPALCLTTLDIHRAEFAACRAMNIPVYSLTAVHLELKAKASSALMQWDVSSILADVSDVALIMYTSGSSDTPRGVVCPHRQILFAIQAIRNVLGIESEDVILAGLPFSFDYGLYQIFIALEARATLVVAPDFSVPMAIPYWLDKFKITTFPGVPSLFSMLLESGLLSRGRLDLSLRRITSTGDVWPLSMIINLKECLPSCQIFPMYGLTECKRVSVLTPQDFVGHEESVGRPLPGTCAMVVDEAGKPLPTGESGELVVMGPHVMRGYLNNPVADGTRFEFDAQKGGSRLFTGDIFRLCPRGFLYFEGRKQGFLKIRGKRISPAMLERRLTSLPQVHQAVVVGLGDPLEGDALFAFIRLVPGVQLSPEAFVEAARPLLPYPLSVQNVLIASRCFPLTPNGKIDRRMLTEKARQTVQLRAH